MEECILCGVEWASDELVDGICIHCDMDTDWMEGYDENWWEDMDSEYNDET